MSWNLQESIPVVEKSGEWITRVDLRGLNGSNIRGCRTQFLAGTYRGTLI